MSKEGSDKPAHPHSPTRVFAASTQSREVDEGAIPLAPLGSCTCIFKG